MKCQDIISILEGQSPAEYAMDWDNVGLLVGRRDQEINKILIAVDATKEVCEYAIANQVDLIITHHPMIFSKLKRINDETVLGRKILSLAEAKIACYAMHTNFDTIGGMAKIAAKKLGMKNLQVLEETYQGEGIGQVGEIVKAMSVYDLAQLVKETFGLQCVDVYGDLERIVERVAISPGSGKSEIGEAVAAKAQVLITGDIGHHEGLDAIEEGLTIIDASHYGLEQIFMQYIYEYLKDFCPDVTFEIYEAGVPFTTV